MNRTTFIGLFFLLLALVAFAEAPQDEIKRRQAELRQIRDQISGLEQKIKEHQQNESEVIDLVETYDRKAGLIRRLIGKFRQEERELQRRIERSDLEIGELEADLKYLKDQYARYVTSAYKSGRTRDMELLLSSKSINQFYVRTAYLRSFTAERRKDAGEIAAKKERLEEAQAHAQEQLTEERRLIAEKAAEEDRLTSLAAERRTVLTKIRKDRGVLQKAVDRQMRAAQQLEGVIESLIEADRIKREHAVAEAERTHAPLPQPPSSSVRFESRKGNLRWPVSAGTVVARFGNQRHPTLRTITVNTGIDIAVDAGTAVTAVAEGEVAKIFWMPSYGNLLILNHANGYRSVYAHLGDISVVEGQRVGEGDLLGESGDSIEGPRLHFELWKDREKQNPEHWLSRQ